MADSVAKIRNRVVNAIADYDMLEDGDKILVAVSGGIDSTVLLSLLIEIQRRAPFQFNLQPVLVHHGFPGSETSHFAEWIKQQGFNLTILDCETYQMAKRNLKEGKSPCQICSRLRRGVLYTYAVNNGISKIAVGHNRDDFNETLLLNMFYSGKLAGMPPIYRASNNQIKVIRPMCHLAKDQIGEYANHLNAPLIENQFCRDIPNNSRYLIRDLLNGLKKENPAISTNILAAQSNIMPSLLMDRRFWDL
ncbi:MAG: tRNA 2-thiocytidine(32) synthetase TtcA [Proteobacteria bacterium]|nr:tRNA 2-thiocytidine(32) synthetase TtcA [Pseudomonadota bacterium]